MLLNDYAYVGLFAAAGAVFVLASFITSWAIRKTKHEPLKYTTYECGEEAEGPSWLQFNVRFYLIALLFVAFEVEIVFIVPWAAAFKALGIVGFIEMAAFLFILLVGLVYAWRKGLLEWR